MQGVDVIDEYIRKDLHEENKEKNVEVPIRRRTIYISLIVLGIIIVAIAGSWYLQQLRGTGTIAPDFSLTDLNGDVFRLSDFQGKVVELEGKHPFRNSPEFNPRFVVFITQYIRVCSSS